MPGDWPGIDDHFRGYVDDGRLGRLGWSPPL